MRAAQLLAGQVFLTWFRRFALHADRPVHNVALSPQEAIRPGVFRGIELRECTTPEPQQNLEDFVARQSLATDFALRLLRLGGPGCPRRW